MYVDSQRQLECISPPVDMPTTCMVTRVGYLSSTYIARLVFRHFEVRLVLSRKCPISQRMQQCHYLDFSFDL